MIKWAVELAPYAISYEPRRAIKVQALADFMAECLTPFLEKGQQEEPAAVWMLCMDGSATSEGSGVGLIVVSPEGHVHEHALKFMFKALNNEAEYEALLASMDLYHALRAKYLCAFSIS